MGRPVRRVSMQMVRFWSPMEALMMSFQCLADLRFSMVFQAICLPCRCPNSPRPGTSWRGSPQHAAGPSATLPLSGPWRRSRRATGARHREPRSKVGLSLSRSLQVEAGRLEKDSLQQRVVGFLATSLEKALQRPEPEETSKS